MTQWFKEPGAAIILLGPTREDLGGTEYLKLIHHREQGSPPLLNLETETAVQACTLRLIRSGLVQSAHDCSDGGLAVALVECCVSGPERKLGAVVQLQLGRLRCDALLFGESQSRVVLSVKPDLVQQVLETAQEMDVQATKLGEVGGDRLVINMVDGGSSPGTRIDLDLDSVFDRWARSLERALTKQE
jgi:phosphoribosylformylglycinamidine (FGAM) synthase-like enzyme